MNVFILGHADISEEQFNKVYVPDINKFLKEYTVNEPVFYIGGEDGTDAYAQEYIHKLGHKMVICDEGEQDNVKYPGENTTHINGYKTYIERDEYMLDKCRVMILFLRNELKSLSSNSMYNFISKSFNSDYADLFMKHVKSKEWESVKECLEESNLYDNIKRQIKQILVL